MSVHVCGKMWYNAVVYILYILYTHIMYIHLYYIYIYIYRERERERERER